MSLKFCHQRHKSSAGIIVYFCVICLVAVCVSIFIEEE